MNFIEGYGPRLKRFAFYPLEKESRINILEGSVRSGKTWAQHSKILQACAYPGPGWRLITGQSKQTIFMNVLNDLFNIVGPSNYYYNHQSGLLRLCGSNWMVMGAKDEGSEKFLRGATILVSICDELVLMPKGYFQMLLTRMSPENARLYGTTNPDQPMHWLKTDFLDDEVLRRKKLLWSMHVTMDDNPNLSPEFIESQKAFYKGVFYERYILGRWVMAEGAIYRDAWSEDLLFDDETQPVTLKNAGGYVDRWVSVDCGVDHPQVYLEFYDDGETIWITNEYRWDSRKEMRQKTDGQYADDLIEFMGPNSCCQVIIPPECASFEAELILRGLWVTAAENEVNEGIATVMGLMAKRKVRIHQHNCRSLATQIQTYAWDPKAALRGVEQPIKSSGGESVDDDVDAMRYGLHHKVPKWRYL